MDDPSTKIGDVSYWIMRVVVVCRGLRDMVFGELLRSAGSSGSLTPVSLATGRGVSVSG